MPSSSLPVVSLAERTVPHHLFGLAPAGVYRAVHVTVNAVGSYSTFSPLPSVPLAGRRGRYIFCATVLQVALTGRYPAHCPAEFGLSSLGCSSRLAPGRHLTAIVWLTANSPIVSGDCELLISDCQLI